MLLQLHHQFADGHTVFLAQTDIDLSDEDLGRKQECHQMTGGPA